MNKDKSLIPPGVYCHGERYKDNEDGSITWLDMCPYWRMNPDKHPQENGECLYLDMRDWDNDHFSLLWDRCKECGINMESDENSAS